MRDYLYLLYDYKEAHRIIINIRYVSAASSIPRKVPTSPRFR